jgi:hypothetical protein
MLEPTQRMGVTAFISTSLKTVSTVVLLENNSLASGGRKVVQASLSAEERKQSGVEPRRTTTAS